MAATTTGSLGPANTAPLKIGDSGSCGAFYGQAFGGLIDEVSLYNRALSTNEIQAIYNAGSAGNVRPAARGSGQLVARKTTLTDNWDSNHGTINGRGFAAGKVGRAFTSPAISVPDAASLRVTNAITVEAWVNPLSVSHDAPHHHF